MTEGNRREKNKPKPYQDVPSYANRIIGLKETKSAFEVKVS